MELKKLPDLTFAEADADTVDGNVLTTVEALLGRTLARADPLRLFLRGIDAILIQQRLLIDQAAKQNLLAYATGDNLDHIGTLVGTDRIAATSATVTLQFTLSAKRETATIIPSGTRATAGDGVLFALDDTVVIAQGDTTAIGRATCTSIGATGNGYAPGEIKTLADPVAFVASVTNTTTSAGGADTEDDDAYRERIHEAPEKFSTAGPSGAYEYYAKQASALISDVAVESPAPCEVKIYPLLTGGEIPGQEILDTVATALNDRTVRPLTDKVTVSAPTAVKYNVTLTYWIDRDDATEAAEIQKAAEQAISDFAGWQKERLGRDINPTELYYRLRSAGVKRAEITEPAATTVTREQVAVADKITATFGGLEDA